MNATEFLNRLNTNFTAAECDLIRRAYDFGWYHHRSQTRDSGEPYFTHCEAVAEIFVTEVFADAEGCAAALLHDVVEDTSAELGQIEQEFGGTIALLVDGLTKIERIQKKSRWERQVATLRKMLLSTVKDARVVLVKLADRLHNMRTLTSLSADRQQRIASETLEIYAPIAHRFGMGQIKSELEDLSLKALHPEAFYRLKELVNQKKQERDALIDFVRVQVVAELAENGLENYEIFGRSKHFYSLYCKMKKGYTFDEIYDKIGLRIVFGDKGATDTLSKMEHQALIGNCYQALGIIHRLWTPLSNRLKDYIGNPKPNKYQSLHTTVMIPDVGQVEFQIRTARMHQTAERGIAAHWRYKEKNTTENFNDELSWLGRVLEADQYSENPHEFLESLRIELFKDDIFVYTPRGDVVQLPQGATLLDFAFAIHTEIGLSCTGGHINGRFAKLGTPLRSGDQVHISRSPSQSPNPNWLNYVVTSKARNKIRQYLRVEAFRHHVELGKEKLLQEAKLQNYKLKLVPSKFEDLIREYHQKSFEHLLEAIGSGNISPQTILRKLFPESAGKDTLPEVEPPVIPSAHLQRGAATVHLKGVGDVLLRFARCCEPIPGDRIVGFITRGRGLTIHRTDCRNITTMSPPEKQRLIPVQWEIPKKKGKFPAKVWVRAYHSETFLERLKRTVESYNSTLTAQISINQREIYGILIIEVVDLDHLDRIIRHLRTMKEVQEINRAKR